MRSTDCLVGSTTLSRRRGLVYLAVCAGAVLSVQWCALAGDASATLERRRYLALNIWEWSTRKSDLEPLVDTAARSGFNAIKINADWGTFEPALNRYDFTLLERNLDYVIKTKGLKAIVTVWLFRSLEKIRSGQDDVLGIGDVQRNAQGKLPRDAVFSFCSERALSRAAKAVARVVRHCHRRYPEGSILCYVTVFSLYAETEYWCYEPPWDYSEAAKGSYRAWLEKRFRRIGRLNGAWKTQHRSFGEIQPPGGFSGAAGLAWYRFRHEALGRAIFAMADAVHRVDRRLKHGVQFGSTWDGAILHRGTVGFTDLCRRSDVVWVDDAPDYNHPFSMDLMRASLPGKWICNEIDHPNKGDDGVYYRLAAESFEHGARIVTVANWGESAVIAARGDLFRRIARDFLSDPVPERKPAATLEIRAQETFRGGTSAYRQRYDALSSGGRNWVDVRFVDDMFGADLFGGDPGATR